MGATLIGALIGVAAGQILLAMLAAPLGLPTFAAVIAVMLGLGAGIDYAHLGVGGRPATGPPAAGQKESAAV